MDVFDGVTSEVIILISVQVIGIIVAMVIAYRDGYKHGKSIGEQEGYNRCRQERSDEDYENLISKERARYMKGVK